MTVITAANSRDFIKCLGVSGNAHESPVTVQEYSYAKGVCVGGNNEQNKNYFKGKALCCSH